jgi:D-glycero-D-manno-heptose 1,7-bisphosphate phosphatase
MLKDAGYFIIVISNQGGISKGVYTKNDVEAVHNLFKEKATSKGLLIDEIYYCPHHSEIENCLCRKPKPLMLEKAIARFNIDPLQSYFIGDSKRDVECAQNANIKGILVDKNINISDVCKKILKK